MDPNAKKNTIRQPKPGSKEARTRELREQADKAAKAKPAIEHSSSSSSHTLKASELPGVAKALAAAKAKTGDAPKPAPAPKPETTPKAPAKPEAKPTKESAVRTSTKKTAKTAGKPASRSKKAAPGTERRKKPARTSGARKAATAAKEKGPNKGEQVVALVKAGWTPKADIMKATGWLDHTVRAFLSRCSKAKKDGGLGLNIERRTHNEAPEYRVAK